MKKKSSVGAGRIKNVKHKNLDTQACFVEAHIWVFQELTPTKKLRKKRKIVLDHRGAPRRQMLQLSMRRAAHQNKIKLQTAFQAQKTLRYTCARFYFLFLVNPTCEVNETGNKSYKK